MDRHFWARSLVAILSVFTLAVGLSLRPVKLRAASIRELTCAVGGACQGKAGDPNFCVGTTTCTKSGSIFIQQVYTSAIKRWCGAGGVSPTCDCNQNNIPQTNCITEVNCTGQGANGNCTGCGNNPTPASTVQTTVNQNGASCTKDSDCGG